MDKIKVIIAAYETNPCNYCIELTTEQMSLLRWLAKNGFLESSIEFYPLSDIETKITE